jgi:putative membrane protein
MAPDEDVRKIADDAMTRLNALQGAEFDTAFAAAQLRVQTAAVDQYGAYSQNGKSAPLRRYAQETLPQQQSFLEYAKRLAGGR